MIYPKGLQQYQLSAPFQLEQGGILEQATIGYHTFGKLNAAKDNVVWVFHALTANSDPVDWWSGVVGAGSLLDPEQYFIVCANVLGSFYGSSNPRDINPATQEAFGLDFPAFTVRDVARLHHELRQHLSIQEIQLGIGGSFGGHQALEFALLEPQVVQSLFLLATAARESAWSIAIHEAQRMAIETDPSWRENSPQAGAVGLKTARALGLISYRTIQSYIDRQTDEQPKLDQHKAASYVRYQGEKLERRFHAHCYWYLSKCLDTHHIGRGRGSLEAVLNGLEIPTTVLGINSDLLIPCTQQQFLAKHLAQGQYVEISSKFGHDGFLIEVAQINRHLKQHLEQFSLKNSL